MMIRKPTFADLIGNPYRQHPRYQGCVGHWMMLAGGGTKLFDLSGFKNHGTLTNMEPGTDWVFGQFGPTLSFDGVNDYVEIQTGGPADFFGGASGATVSAWVKVTATAGRKFVFHDTWSATFTRVRVEVQADETLVISARDANGATQQVKTTTAALTTGVWHHIVGVIDVAADTITIFVDGVVADSSGAISFAATSFAVDATMNTRIGADGNNGNPFDRLIDDMHIYNRALTVAEIRSMFLDPFLEFRRPTRSFFAPAAAGGGNEGAAMYHHLRNLGVYS